MWCQHQDELYLGDDRVARCIGGAIANCDTDTYTVYAIINRVSDKIGGAVENIPVWNDAPGRKHEDVLRLFDDLIKEEYANY